MHFVQNVGGPRAGAGPEEDEWEELSRHRTGTATAKRCVREYRQMKRNCGSNSWNDHYRAIIDGKVYDVEDCHFYLRENGVVSLDGIFL